MVDLKLNGAFWANCTIFKKKIRLIKQNGKKKYKRGCKNKRKA